MITVFVHGVVSVPSDLPFKLVFGFLCVWGLVGMRVNDLTEPDSVCFVIWTLVLSQERVLGL